MPSLDPKLQQHTEATAIGEDLTRGGSGFMLVEYPAGHVRQAAVPAGSELLLGALPLIIGSVPVRDRPLLHSLLSAAERCTHPGWLAYTSHSMHPFGDALEHAQTVLQQHSSTQALQASGVLAVEELSAALTNLEQVLDAVSDAGAWPEDTAAQGRLVLALLPLTQLCNSTVCGVGSAMQMDGQGQASRPGAEMVQHDSPATVLRAALEGEVAAGCAHITTGPHTAIRHPAARTLWACTWPGRGEVAWDTFWEGLSHFLGGRGLSCPLLSNPAGLLHLIQSAEHRWCLQAAIHNMGNRDTVNPAELDAALEPEADLGACLSWLLRFKEPLAVRDERGLVAPAIFRPHPPAAGSSSGNSRCSSRGGSETRVEGSGKDGSRDGSDHGRGRAGGREESTYEQQGHVVSRDMERAASGTAASTSAPSHAAHAAERGRVPKRSHTRHGHGRVHVKECEEGTRFLLKPTPDGKEFVLTVVPGTAVTPATPSNGNSKQSLRPKSSETDTCAQAPQPPLWLPPEHRSWAVLQPPLVCAHEEVTAVVHALRHAGRRLVVITGPHGCGKSAVASAAASELVACREWPVARVAELRGVRGVDEAGHVIADALRLPHYPVAMSGMQRLEMGLRRAAPTGGGRMGLILEGAEVLLLMALPGAAAQVQAQAQAHAQQQQQLSFPQAGVAPHSPAVQSLPLHKLGLGQVGWRCLAPHGTDPAAAAGALWESSSVASQYSHDGASSPVQPSSTCSVDAAQHVGAKQVDALAAGLVASRGNSNAALSRPLLRLPQARLRSPALELLHLLLTLAPHLQIVMPLALMSDMWGPACEKALNANLAPAGEGAAAAGTGSLDVIERVWEVVQVGPLRPGAAGELLTAASGGTAPPGAVSCVVAEHGGLPSLLRVLGCGVAAGAISAATLRGEEAAQESDAMEDGGAPNAGGIVGHDSGRSLQLVRRILHTLTVAQRLGLSVLASAEAALPLDQVELLLSPLGGPLAVHDLLRAAWRLGLLHVRPQTLAIELDVCTRAVLTSDMAVEDGALQQAAPQSTHTADATAAITTAPSPEPEPGQGKGAEGTGRAEQGARTLTRWAALLSGIGRVLGEGQALYVAGHQFSALARLGSARRLVEHGLRSVGKAAAAYASTSAPATTFIRLMSAHLNDVLRLILSKPQLVVLAKLTERLCEAQPATAQLRAHGLVSVVRTLAFARVYLDEAAEILSEAQAAAAVATPHDQGHSGSAPSDSAPAATGQCTTGTAAPVVVAWGGVAGAAAGAGIPGWEAGAGGVSVDEAVPYLETSGAGLSAQEVCLLGQCELAQAREDGPLALEACTRLVDSLEQRLEAMATAGGSSAAHEAGDGSSASWARLRPARYALACALLTQGDLLRAAARTATVATRGGDMTAAAFSTGMEVRGVGRSLSAAGCAQSPSSQGRRVSVASAPIAAAVSRLDTASVAGAAAAYQQARQVLGALFPGLHWLVGRAGLRHAMCLAHLRGVRVATAALGGQGAGGRGNGNGMSRSSSLSLSRSPSLHHSLSRGGSAVTVHTPSATHRSTSLHAPSPHSYSPSRTCSGAGAGETPATASFGTGVGFKPSTSQCLFPLGGSHGHLTAPRFSSAGCGGAASGDGEGTPGSSPRSGNGPLAAAATGPSRLRIHAFQRCVSEAGAVPAPPPGVDAVRARRGTSGAGSLSMCDRLPSECGSGVSLAAPSVEGNVEIARAAGAGTVPLPGSGGGEAPVVGMDAWAAAAVAGVDAEAAVAEAEEALLDSILEALVVAQHSQSAFCEDSAEALCALALLLAGRARVRRQVERDSATSLRARLAHQASSNGGVANGGTAGAAGLVAPSSHVATPSPKGNQELAAAGVELGGNDGAVEGGGADISAVTCGLKGLHILLELYGESHPKAWEGVEVLVEALNGEGGHAHAAATLRMHLQHLRLAGVGEHGLWPGDPGDCVSLRISRRNAAMMAMVAGAGPACAHPALQHTTSLSSSAGKLNGPGQLNKSGKLNGPAAAEGGTDLGRARSVRVSRASSLKRTTDQSALGLAAADVPAAHALSGAVHKPTRDLLEDLFGVFSTAHAHRSAPILGGMRTLCGRRELGDPDNDDEEVREGEKEERGGGRSQGGAPSLLAAAGATAGEAGAARTLALVERPRIVIEFDAAGVKPGPVSGPPAATSSSSPTAAFVPFKLGRPTLPVIIASPGPDTPV